MVRWVTLTLALRESVVSGGALVASPSHDIILALALTTVLLTIEVSRSLNTVIDDVLPYCTVPDWSNHRGMRLG